MLEIDCPDNDITLDLDKLVFKVDGNETNARLTPEFEQDFMTYVHIGKHHELIDIIEEEIKKVI
jgi:hypothetical protein